MKNKKLFGSALLLITAFIWGMAFSFQSKAGEVLGPFSVGATRMSLAGIEMFVICLIIDMKKGKNKEKPEKAYTKDTVIGGILNAVFLFIASTLQQIGIDNTTVGKAGFISALYILFVPLITSLFFSKKVTLKTWIAVVVAIFGMFLLTMSSAEGFSKGDIIIFSSSIFYAIQIITVGIYSPKGNSIKIAEIGFIGVAVLSWIGAFIFESPCIEDIRKVAGAILYTGVISAGVGFTFQAIGQKYADPTPASICMSFESVFAAIGGVFILGQTMSLREILGCVIMFAAMILVQLPEKTKETTNI